ncbi:MAG: THUMP domain-containing protein [Pyrodictiaceae archaeon]
MKLLLTTSPGIEDIVAEEARYKLNARIIEYRRARGRIIVDLDDENLYLVEKMRSIHHARILLHQGKVCSSLECLRNLEEVLRSIDYHIYITPHTTFAVRVERVGDHEYNSMDVAKLAGRVVQEEVARRYSAKPRVDLDYPNIIIAIDIIGSEILIGVELTGEISLHRRGYRIYDHPAALKPTLAYAMLMISGVHDGELVVDPMCGGGTIAIEAAYLLEHSPIHCNDVNKSYLKGAMMNAIAARVSSRIRFGLIDAKELHKHYNSIDIIVTNPPYGIRMGSPGRIKELYEKFVAAAARVLNKSLVIISAEHRFLKNLLTENGLSIVHERDVAHGGLWLKIIKAK